MAGVPALRTRGGSVGTARHVPDSGFWPLCVWLGGVLAATGTDSGLPQGQERWEWGPEGSG